MLQPPEVQYRAVSRRRTLPRRELTQTPPILRRLARWVVLALPAMALVAALLPWQQSALGTGEVLALDPSARLQSIEAPITGRILAWEVSEGTLVQEGDLLLRLGDNDPERLTRLERQLQALDQERVAAQAQQESKERALAAKVASREQVDAEYQAKIAELRRKALGESASLATSRLQQDRVQQLQAEGIASDRERELADLSVAKQDAKVEAMELEVQALGRAQDKALAAADAQIAVAEAEVAEVVAKRAALDGKVQELQGKLARQRTQEIRAPRSGTVLALEDAPVGGQVKAGDPLLQLVPQDSLGAVALYVDGQDLPWIQVGDPVRVVFEGIPALQWVGPPGDGVGTFPATVALIDASPSDNGRFRVVAVPDGPWPTLRQGVRAKGFVLLGEVRLGWEIWRRINSFPPDTPQRGAKPPSAKKPRAPQALK